MELLVKVLLLLSIGAGLQFTCYQSEVYGGLYGLCPLVNWRAARIVNETEITEDEVLPVLPYTENRNLVLVGSSSFGLTIGMVRQSIELLGSDGILLYRPFASIVCNPLPILSSSL